MVDSAPKFTIKELGGRRREITLTGRALPFRPLELSGKQRVDINFYPGNPQGISQVLGPTEEPTSIRGFWKDKYLADTSEKFMGKDGQAVRSCLEATDIMDSIRKEGQRLEVQWGFVIRRGYLESFSQKWHNVHDVEWDASFKWDSQAGPDIFAVPPENNIPETSNLLNSLRDLLRDLSSPPFPAALEFMDTLTSVIQTAAYAANVVEQVGGNFMDLAFSPLDMFNSAAAACRQFAAAGAALADELDARLPEMLRFDRNVDPFGPSPYTPDEELAAQFYAAELKDVARRMVREADAARRAMESRTDKTLLATHVAVGDEDLRELAVRYYNNSNEWRRLLIYNGLTDSLLEPGQVVLIPALLDG